MPYTFIAKLIYAHLPEIKMVGIYFIFPELLGYFLIIIDEFGTAGAKRRAYPCYQI